jgi:endonuclease/exonuclease/phosphatase family metal-dependent hydrolase
LPDLDGPDLGASPLQIGTLNIRNTADRWRQRRHLVVAQLAQLRPDVIGLQELRRWPSQAEWITRRLNETLGAEPPYRYHSRGKTGLLGSWEGIAVLTRLPVVARGWLDLHGEHRVAIWVRVGLVDGAVVEICNTHLSSRDQALRDRQARLIIDHLAAPGGYPAVVVGDLNAGPTSSTLGVLGERLRSAYTLAHGAEPAKTWPTPLRPGAGKGSVIDYVLVDEHVEVIDAWLTFGAASSTDPTLVASDHFGIAATVTVRHR